ncbi:hypothetical protein ES332_D11G312600v1 [Gossypium tomentosum]|uniref:Uncharacterized protein n=1 Tax=Gossypium tomentosum TaxID=34277 RepID=A0A5D2IW35_GOSTO|nr:hypothetical protein ES332_D11G312600v1 [Gossypium tomentosum]
MALLRYGRIPKIFCFSVDLYSLPKVMISYSVSVLPSQAEIDLHPLPPNINRSYQRTKPPPAPVSLSSWHLSPTPPSQISGSIEAICILQMQTRVCANGGFCLLKLGYFWDKFSILL